MQTFRMLTVVSLFLACTPKETETGGDSSSGVLTDGASATPATATDPTTDETSTTGVSSTTGQASTTGVEPTTAQTASSGTEDTSASTDPNTTTTTGDTEGSNLPDACSAVCAHWDECKPGVVGPLDKCIAGCSEDIGSPACTAAIADQWACIAGLSCEEALKFIEGTLESCLPEVQAADEACTELGCNGEVGGGSETCEFQQQCDGPRQSIECDGDLCTCSESGIPVKDCPADGLCDLDSAEHNAAINACCGWNWK